MSPKSQAVGDGEGHRRSSMRRARLASILLGGIGLLGAPASAIVELHEVSHESLRFHTPGNDGFIGTADDIVVPCLDPGPDTQCGTPDDVDSTPINPNGSTGFVFIDEIPPFLGFEFILVFGDGMGTLTLETDAALGAPGVYPDFAFQAHTLPPGPELFNFDVPGDPHRVEVFADQTFTVEYTQQTCIGAPTCAIPGLLLDLTGDLIGRGVILFRGQDPQDLIPVLDPANAQAVVDYLAFLTTILPDDWAAVTLTGFGPGRLKVPDNATGLIAGNVDGGLFSFVNVAYTVPEPSGAGFLIAAWGLLLAAARARR